MNSQAPNNNDWIPTASVAIFILFAIGIVGYFYYQNQELKKIIADYQKATPIPTVISTPLPTMSASPSATPKTRVSSASAVFKISN